MVEALPLACPGRTRLAHATPSRRSPAACAPPVRPHCAQLGAQNAAKESALSLAYDRADPGLVQAVLRAGGAEVAPQVSVGVSALISVAILPQL